MTAVVDAFRGCVDDDLASAESASGPSWPAASEAMANEPELEWGEGRFTPLFPRLMRLLAPAYGPPPSASGRRHPTKA